MFNIKKKIYVAHDEELVDLMYERSIVLHSRFKSLVDIEGVEKDKNARGVLFSFNNYSDMLKNKFNDDVSLFHDLLNVEENLLIIVDKKDYARIYTEIQMELANDYGVSEENLDVMRDQQRMKDFFRGNQDMRKFCYAGKTKDSSFERIVQKVEKNYKPTGNLYRNVAQLPLEFIFAMYKWGNISKTQANTKIANIVAPLLVSEIDIIIESGRIAMSTSPAILQEYTGDSSIKTVDDCIKTLFTDPLLLKLFCSDDSDVALNDKAEVAAIKKLCSTIISNYESLEIQPEVDQAELEFFFELYEKQDIDVIDKARVNLINTGMVASRQGKFNTGLIMAV